jgi:hypothetical protein
MFGESEGPGPAFGAPDPTLCANGNGPGLDATVGRANEGVRRDTRFAGGCGFGGRLTVDCTVTGGSGCGFRVSLPGATWVYAGAECRRLDATSTPTAHSHHRGSPALLHLPADLRAPSLLAMSIEHEREREHRRQQA